jgi:phage-related protein
MKEKLVAYRGKRLTLEWYLDAQEKSEALEYFIKLTRDRQRKIIHLFYLLGDIGKIFNEEKFRNEGDQIYAFKASADRFLCFFFNGSKVIITNAYEKKTAKMPPKEKQRALRAKMDYTKRCKDGNYYG